MDDPYDLNRFVVAQNPAYGRVLQELQSGEKRSHWIWYIFPQIEGLGFSNMAKRFAIASRAEAESYLQHPILGARLMECTKLVLDVKGRTIEQIFGYPDYMKFRSSMTLFQAVADRQQIFAQALAKYFDGLDQRTVDILGK
jgi:uncharacterized protein (DUF1810 family)